MIVEFKRTWFQAGNERKVDRTRSTSGKRWRANEPHSLPDSLFGSLPKDAKIIIPPATNSEDEAAEVDVPEDETVEVEDPKDEDAALHDIDRTAALRRQAENDKINEEIEAEEAVAKAARFQAELAAEKTSRETKPGKAGKKGK